MARTIRNRKRSAAAPRRRPPEPAASKPAPLELLPPTRPAGVAQKWLPGLFIAALVVLFYIPSFDNGFVSWDDDHYIFDNHQVHYTDGIKSIWFDVFHHSDEKFVRSAADQGRVSHQYYPLVFTIYWIEFRFHEWFNGADPNKTIQQNIADGKMTASSFHVVSVVMHAINAFLIISVLRALGFSNWVAWVAALLFCLHPMQVATVAWAAERKNIVSLMFYLLSLRAYIHLRRWHAAVLERGEKRWGGFALRLLLCLALFQAALFSKTVALTLPVMLFLTDRLLERRSRKGIVPFGVVAFLLIAMTLFFIVPNKPDFDKFGSQAAMFVLLCILIGGVVVACFFLMWPPRLVLASTARIVPFVVLSCIAAWTTIHVEDRQRTIPIEDKERPFVAGAVTWFYPAKMIAPVDQSPVYRLWDPAPDVKEMQIPGSPRLEVQSDPVPLRWYIPVLAAVIVGLLTIIYRDRLSPHFRWAMLLYVVFTLPMMGFKNINYFQFSFVADHYFYHGAVGLFVIVALAAQWLVRRFPSERLGTQFMTGGVIAVAVVLGMLTARYCNVWQTPESFWGRTIEVNPDCWPAYYNTANARLRAYGEIGKLQKSMASVSQQIAQAPDPQDKKSLTARLGRLKTELRDVLAEWDLTDNPHPKEALLEDAAKRYERVAEINKLISQPFDRLLGVRQEQHDWKAGLADAEAAARRFPHLTKYYYNAAGFAMKSGDKQRAANNFRKAGVENMKRVVMYLRRKQYCPASRYCDDAILAYNKALEATPTSELQDEFRQQLVTMLEVYRGCGSASLVEGRSRLDEGNPCEAAKSFRRSVRNLQEAIRIAQDDGDLTQELQQAQADYQKAQQACNK